MGTVFQSFDCMILEQISRLPGLSLDENSYAMWLLD